MSAPWTPTPEAIVGRLDPVDVERRWSRLHAGDALDRPTDAALLEGWTDYHNGHFQRARDAGLRAGSAGWSLAQKATCVYAVYVEPHESTRLILLSDVAERALEHQALDRRQAAAWYWQGYALGRFSQGISVAKALAQGLGGKVKESLEKAIALSPKHADARIALGAFHAEVIDKVGSLIGGMTYGAKKDTGLKLFQAAIKLNPTSAIAKVEYANGLVMLEGDKRMKEATQLYEEAAACEPLDAMERLDVDMAREELEDE